MNLRHMKPYLDQFLAWSNLKLGWAAWAIFLILSSIVEEWECDSYSSSPCFKLDKKSQPKIKFLIGLIYLLFACICVSALEFELWFFVLLVQEQSSAYCYILLHASNSLLLYSFLCLIYLSLVLCLTCLSFVLCMI